MLTALFVTFATISLALARQPTCPNGQLPKQDELGNSILCLPGTLHSSTCGMDHACFFSGMNYMCCPSNEPTSENQPSCQSPSLTVLDSHGLPLKCSPRTRQCPQDNMYCSDVGLAFICCEKLAVTEEKIVKPAEKSGKRAQRRKKVKATPAPKTTLACPTNTIGLLDHNGEPRFCNATSKCPGWGQFCHGDLKQNICCERYQYASNVLEKQQPRTVAFNSRGSFVENRSPYKPKAISIAITPSGRRSMIDRTTPEVENIVDSAAQLHSQEVTKFQKHSRFSSGEQPGQRTELSEAPVIAKKVAAPTTTTTEEPTTTTEAPTTTEEPTTQEPAIETEPLIVFTTTVAPTTRARLPPRSRAHAVRTFSDTAAPLSHELSRGHPSELLNTDEKRTMAQQFLMHQIRNGWPYDDRFYRPDMDAFSADQRRDIARLRFIDSN